MKPFSMIALWLMTTMLFVGCGQDGATPISAASNADEVTEDHVDHVEEDEHAGEASSVELTPEQIASASLQILETGPARIRETLPLYGVITPNASAVRQVTARYSGVIRNVARNFGDPVRQGEELATVESNESLQTYTITSPLTGVVTLRDANPGEQTGDRVLFTVADLSTVWVELAVFPRDVAKIKVGQSVRIVAADVEAADGSIIWIAPFGTAANQTLTARVLLENPERRWAPGLYVTALVALAESEASVAVRNAALQTVEGSTAVFVEGEHGFEARNVEIGRSDDEYTEILTGLTAGETYVADNSFILKAELGKGEAEHSH